jgi:hypothetical protein
MAPSSGPRSFDRHLTVNAAPPNDTEQHLATLATGRLPGTLSVESGTAKPAKHCYTSFGTKRPPVQIRPPRPGKTGP